MSAESSSAGSSPSPPVLVETLKAEAGQILRITLNRPEAHNAVNADSAAILLSAWQRFRDDDSLVVAIVQANGRQAFCAGADLKGLAGLANLHATPTEVEAAVREGTGPMGGTRIVQTKPVITVSHGYTYAGGLELFCHGHIRLAEPSATFSVACRRWGVPLVDGGTVYLPRLIGWGSALPLIITGQRISAERAYQIGLVWELVPEGEGAARALSYAEQICAQPRDALVADLRSAILGSHLPVTDALELEARNLHPVIRSASMQAGVAAFQAGKRFWFT